MTKYIVTDILLKQLILNEGLKLQPYKCTAGKWTVGVGRNYQENKFSTRECVILFGVQSITVEAATELMKKTPLTKQKAMLLLENDILKVVNQLSTRSEWKAVQGDSVRERVLIDLVFNMGLTTWNTFKNTIKFIAAKDFEQAADNLIKSKWYKQVGNRGPRIVTMLRTGKDAKEYSNIVIPKREYIGDGV